MIESRPPFPPFTLETAIQKVRIAEDSWNTCNPEKVSLGYAPDSRWRNRSEFLVGRPAIVELHRGLIEIGAAVRPRLAPVARDIRSGRIL